MPAPGAAELTARAIIDTSLYLVLATADSTGRPWSSPVYFAHDEGAYAATVEVEGRRAWGGWMPGPAMR